MKISLEQHALKVQSLFKRLLKCVYCNAPSYKVWTAFLVIAMHNILPQYIIVTHSYYFHAPGSIYPFPILLYYIIIHVFFVQQNICVIITYMKIFLSFASFRSQNICVYTRHNISRKNIFVLPTFKENILIVNSNCC